VQIAEANAEDAAELGIPVGEVFNVEHLRCAARKYPAPVYGRDSDFIAVD